MADNRKYKMLFDWHTHTTYSHGKGSIADNVAVAVRKGLESVAISDHGPGHFAYGFREREIPDMRRDVEEVQKLYPQIKIYLSAEANIINENGDLDVKRRELDKFDFLLAGYHFGTIGSSLPFAAKLHSTNLICGKTKKWSSAVVDRNTELVVKALGKNKITVLTHPGDKGQVDMNEVAKACAKAGTYMEISHRHVHLTAEEIKIASKYDVKFIVGSDAHLSENVGEFGEAIKKIEESGIDIDRIVNLVRI